MDAVARAEQVEQSRPLAAAEDGRRRGTPTGPAPRLGPLPAIFGWLRSMAAAVALLCACAAAALPASAQEGNIVIAVTFRIASTDFVFTDMNEGSMVSVNEASEDGAMGGGQLNVCIQVTGPLPVRVSLRVLDGTAVSGLDYSASGIETTQFDFADEDSRLRCSRTAITVNGDLLFEGDETVLFEAYAAAVGAVATATLTIIDDESDRGELRTHPSQLSVDEGGMGEIGVSLSAPPVDTMTIRLQAEPGNFVGFTADELIFASDDWEGTRTLGFALQQRDGVYHSGGEQGRLRLRALGGGGYDGTTGDFLLRVNDIDTPSGQISLSLSPADDLVEGAAGDHFVLQLTARLNEAAFNEDRELTLSIDPDSSATVGPGPVHDGLPEEEFTATLSAGRYFLRSSTGNESLWSLDDYIVLRIPAREREIRADFLVDIRGDDIDEGDFETIILGGSAPGLTVASVTLNIRDDDTRGLEIEPTELTLVEGGAIETYRVRLTSDPNPDIGEGLVSVFIGIEGSEPLSDAEPDMIMRAPNKLTFGGSDPWYGWQTVEVSLAENDDRHDVRMATLNHDRITGADYEGGFAASELPVVSLTLVDRSILISTDSLTVVEGEEASYTVTLTAPPGGEVSVELRVVGDRRILDDLDRVERTLVFNPQNWHQPQTVSFRPNNRWAAQNPEVTIEHRTTDADYGDLRAPPLRLTLLDEDPPLNLRFSEREFSIGEGESGGRISFCLIVDYPDPDDRGSLPGYLYSIRLNWTLSQGSAVIPDDANPDSQEGNFLFRSTPTSVDRIECARFLLNPLDDAVAEGDEIMLISARLEAGSRASVNPIPTATLRITDNDFPGIRTSKRELAFEEGSEVVSYTVELTSQPGATVDVSVDIRAVAGSGIVPANIRREPALLRFTPAVWNLPQTVTIRLEGTEGLILNQEELIIAHRGTSTDSFYAGREAQPIRLVLIDTTLETLQLRADGALIPLRRQNGDDGGFDSGVLEYGAILPFEASEVDLRATPGVTPDNAATNNQNPGEVYLFLGPEALENGQDVAGIQVGLPEVEDNYVFLVEVSVPLPGKNGESLPPAVRSYTLRLRRALPDDAELQVFLVDEEGEGQRKLLTPETPLSFDTDENYMDLIFVVRGNRDGRDYSSYSISSLRIRGLMRSLIVEPGQETELAGGGFETPVRLRRRPGFALETDLTSS